MNWAPQQKKKKLSTHFANSTHTQSLTCTLSQMILNSLLAWNLLLSSSTLYPSKMEVFNRFRERSRVWICESYSPISQPKREYFIRLSWKFFSIIQTEGNSVLSYYMYEWVCSSWNRPVLIVLTHSQILNSVYRIQ